MRLLILTSNPEFESTPWWRVIASTQGISDVLLVCERRPRRAWSSLRRNLRRHGPLWIPYRVFHLLRDFLGKPRSDDAQCSYALPVPTERVDVDSLHDPLTLSRIRQWAPDVGLSIGAPILRTELFSIPARGTVNLHLGKTPEYRGAPPGFWELWTHATEIGATVHWIDSGLDSGPVVAQKVAPIYPDDTLAMVTDRAEALGTVVLKEALQDIVYSNDVARPQTGAGHTYRMPTVSQRMRLNSRIAARRIVKRCTPRHLIKYAASIFLLMIVRPARDHFRGRRGTHPVRVFTYHRVTALCRDGMTISPREFRRQLKYVTRTHDVVSLDAALDALENGTPIRRPMAAITFDDGYQNVYANAWSEMRTLRIPGFVFLATDAVGTTQRYPHDEHCPVREYLPIMSWDEVRTLHSDGWGFGGHTATHARLSELQDNEAWIELAAPIAALSEKLEITRPVMAYPFGAPTDMTDAQLAMAADLGYRSVCSNHGGENHRSAHRSTIGRIDLGGDHDRLAWQAYVHGFNLAAIRRVLRGRS